MNSLNDKLNSNVFIAKRKCAQVNDDVLIPHFSELYSQTR